MKTKLLSFILAFELIMPIQAFAKKEVEDGAEVDIRACGNFVIKADQEDDFASPTVCRTDDKITDKRWKTKDAEVELHVSKSQLAKAKSPKQLMDQVLLEMIQQKVKAKLESFAWLNSIENIKSEDPAVKKQIKEVTDKYEEFKKQVLKDDGKGAKHEVQKLLTLYPDIEDEILQSHPDYKPLICKYELHKHREKILKICAKTLAISAAIVTLVGGPATAYFWIPALPKILMIAGGAETIAGALKIGDAIVKWDDVRAANTAKTLLQFNKENEDLLSKLKKDPEKNKEAIKYLQDHRLSSSEIDRLKNVKKLKRKEYTQLLGGLMNTAFGAAAIYGGVWAGKQFMDFKAKAPANVTDPYVPPTTGGGYTGPGADDGG